MENFGRKLKQLRIHERLTQVEFAALLKITQANVSQLESGSCLPTGETLSKLYQVYPHLDFNWLIKGLAGSPFRKQENYDLSYDRSPVASDDNRTRKGLFD